MYTWIPGSLVLLHALIQEVWVRLEIRHFWHAHRRCCCCCHPYTTLWGGRQMERTSCNNPGPKKHGTMCAPANTSTQHHRPTGSIGRSWTELAQGSFHGQQIVPPRVHAWTTNSFFLWKGKSKPNKHLLILIYKWVALVAPHTPGLTQCHAW